MPVRRQSAVQGWSRLAMAVGLGSCPALAPMLGWGRLEILHGLLCDLGFCECCRGWGERWAETCAGCAPGLGDTVTGRLGALTAQTSGHLPTAERSARPTGPTARNTELGPDASVPQNENSLKALREQWQRQK